MFTRMNYTTQQSASLCCFNPCMHSHRYVMLVSCLCSDWSWPHHRIIVSCVDTTASSALLLPRLGPFRPHNKDIIDIFAILAFVLRWLIGRTSTWRSRDLGGTRKSSTLMRLDDENECDSRLARLPAVPRFRQYRVAELSKKIRADVFHRGRPVLASLPPPGGRNKSAILSSAMCLILSSSFQSCAVFLLVHYQRMESVHQVYTILLHSYVNEDSVHF